MSITIPDFSDIELVQQDALIKTFGNTINFDPSTTTGQLVYNLSGIILLLYQILQESYSASRVDQAQGKLLDDLMVLSNIKRIDGLRTVCKSCILTGDNGTVIPQYSQARDTNGILFQSAVEATIIGTSATVDFISVDFGQYDVEVNALNSIVVPILGWSAITNPTPGVGGADDESDMQLRRRLITSAQNLSGGYEGAIRGAVENIVGVSQAYVYTNYSNDVGPMPWNAPAHSFGVVIQYDDISIEPQIAEAIFSRNPACGTFNTASGGAGYAKQANVTITGGPLAVLWTQAKEVPLNFIINVIEQAEVTSDNITTVTNTIKDFLLANSLIGGTIYYSKIYAAIVNALDEVLVEAVYMSINPPLPTDVSDVSANFWEVLVIGQVTVQYGG